MSLSFSQLKMRVQVSGPDIFCEYAQGNVLPELYLAKMAFHVSAQNDTISQVKLAITELVIHTAPA